MSDEHSTSRISSELDFCDEEQVGEFISGLLLPSEDPETLGWLGNYHVQKIIGRGGMGVVLKAYDASLYRAVAIKVVAPQLALNRKARLRLVNEARAAACINHPNIVTIHAIEEAKSLPYVVMEYVQGRTLQNRIANFSPLSYTAILQLSTQIATGLAAAHEHGVIHRDIKPGNILLEDGIERVKITDFGLAKVRMELAGLTTVGNIVGTPAYLSPEQITGEAIDHRCDQFSLGCVIYAMAAGRSPFQGPNPAAILHNVAHRKPVPLLRVRADVPDSLSNVVDRLLHKNPDKRFDSTEDISVILANLLVNDYRQKPSIYLSESTISLRLPTARSGMLKSAIAVCVLAACLLAVLFDLAGIRSRMAGSFPRERQADDRKISELQGNHAPRAKKSSASVADVQGSARAEGELVAPSGQGPKTAGDRRAAHWALASGATITLDVKDAETIDIAQPGELPAQEFALQKIRFPSNAKLEDDFEILAEAPHLNHVYLAHVPVTDDSLRGFKNLKSLTYLSLQNTKISSAGLEHLAGLTNLKILWLDNTSITDSGIHYLRNFAKLTGLGLGRTQISDESLETIALFKKLKTLTLPETKVSDVGLKSIEQLPHLEVLDLMGTAVTDAGIPSLCKLQKLKNLNIAGTKISMEGRQRLRDALQNCEIKE